MPPNWIAFPALQTLDVVGPVEVFSMPDGIANGGESKVEPIASAHTILTAGGGLRLPPTAPRPGRAARSKGGSHDSDRDTAV